MKDKLRQGDIVLVNFRDSIALFKVLNPKFDTNLIRLEIIFFGDPVFKDYSEGYIGSWDRNYITASAIVINPNEIETVKLLYSQF